MIAIEERVGGETRGREGQSSGGFGVGGKHRGWGGIQLYRGLLCSDPTSSPPLAPLPLGVRVGQGGTRTRFGSREPCGKAYFSAPAFHDELGKCV